MQLPAGVVADRYPRKTTLSLCVAGEALCAVSLVGAGVAGILTVNVEPLPTVLRSEIVNPCRSAIPAAMARPSPSPLLRSRSGFPSWWNS